MRALIATLCFAAVVSAPAGGQVSVEDAGDPAYVTRGELQAQYDELMSFASSPAYSEHLREDIRQSARLLQNRLTLGDFQVGDRIWIGVENQVALSDTFLVDLGPTLVLPTVGDVPLAGVLRSELRDHLTSYLSTFLREPIVRARGLVRISVMGSIGQPGFYMFPGEVVLTDAIMLAGGPGQQAILDNIRIERGNGDVVQGAEVREAIVRGHTLDQLNIRAGDRITIPEKTSLQSIDAAIRTLLVVLSIPLTIFTLTQIFN